MKLNRPLILSGIIYRLEIIAIHVIILYWLTGTIDFSIKTGLIVNGINMIVYYAHHYFFLKYFNKE